MKKAESAHTRPEPDVPRPAAQRGPSRVPWRPALNRTEANRLATEGAPWWLRSPHITNAIHCHLLFSFIRKAQPFQSGRVTLRAARTILSFLTDTDEAAERGEGRRGPERRYIDFQDAASGTAKLFLGLGIIAPAFFLTCTDNAE